MTETAAPISSATHAGPSRLLSDSRLTRRATKGDRRAFEAIYQRYHQELYRFCLAMVGNPQDAQDALQNTMVKVLRALPGEERHIELKPWLYRIARNEAIETVRKRRDSAELESEHTPSPLQIAETAEARERLRRLIADLEELPERQRGALVMRELAGLGFEQIAAAFETSPAVARQTVYEARLSLRQMEEGREMSCETVMRELSDADGRVTRRREFRAHLRSCAGCRAFRDSIAERRTNLAAIAPLPVAASLGLLHGVFTGQASAAAGAGGAAGAGAAGGGITGAAGGGIASTVGAGKVIATSAIVKSAATVAVVAAVGVTAADRSGLIDVPLPGGSKAAKNASESSAPQQHGDAATGAHGESSDEGNAGAHGRGKGKGARGKARRGSQRRSRSTRARSRGRRGRHSHGGSRAGRHGRPNGLPAASSHGQQTSAAHKSPHAKPAPAGGGPSKSKGAPAPSSPPPKSSSPPKEESPETAPAPPPAPPGQTKPGKGESASESVAGNPEETSGP
jgi:RNA polymerase sigma factor (sigma-70 family)